MSPHTKAKHEILNKYLQGWFPILSRTTGRIIYLDGFAGSGEYNDGSLGSPISAIEIAHSHKLNLPSKIMFYFIEKDDDRITHLKELLNKRYSLLSDGKYKKLPDNFSVHVEQGEFNSVIKTVIDSLEKMGTRLENFFQE